MLLSEKESSQTFQDWMQKKVISPEKIALFCEKQRQAGKSIVTLNGSFDLLHPGHLEMLFQASQQGDIFLLLLNTDASIKRYKSPDRPINPLSVRLQNVAALEMVDYVSWFDEDDPRTILEKIRPQVHANGSEYGENCLEADLVKSHGGRIHVVDLVSGFSSTNLIKKIQSLCV